MTITHTLSSIKIIVAVSDQDDGKPRSAYYDYIEHVIVIRQSLINKLNENELKWVVGHEVAHALEEPEEARSLYKEKLADAFASQYVSPEIGIRCLRIVQNLYDKSEKTAIEELEQRILALHEIIEERETERLQQQMEEGLRGLERCAKFARLIASYEASQDPNLKTLVDAETQYIRTRVGI
jgi:hypothetical protein